MEDARKEFYFSIMDKFQRKTRWWFSRKLIAHSMKVGGPWAQEPTILVWFTRQKKGV